MSERFHCPWCDNAQAPTPPVAPAPDATWECDHVGCSNGCTTRAGVCIPCLRARLGASRDEALAALERILQRAQRCSVREAWDEICSIAEIAFDALAAARPGPAERAE